MLLEKLIVPLIADIDQFKRSLAEAENLSSTSVGNIGNSLSSIGSKMTKTGAVGTAALTVPLIAFGSAAKDAASDLEESMSKVNVVFGESGSNIVAWSETSAEAMGISQQVALEAAGTFGNLFSTMGLGDDASANMSTSLIQLSSDLASFNNMDPTEVLDKLRSGLVGETEPLRALGVNLSAAAVTAKAMELGLADANGELSAAALATARYELIMEQTGLAQGDFARTSDGVANQTRIAEAEFENLKAQLGEQLLPVMTSLLNAALPILQWFNDLDPATKKTIVTIGGIVAIIPPIITALGGLATGVSAIIGLFGAGGGLAGVGAVISGTVLPAIGGALTFLATNPVGWLILAITALVVVIKVFGKDALNTVKMIWEIVKHYFGQVADFLSNTFTKAWEGIKDAIRSVIEWVQKLIDKFKNIKIPDWLTPGSPTPFEIGLRGISSAMKEASLHVLPKYTANLSINKNVPATSAVRGENSELADALKAARGQQMDEYKLAVAIRDVLLQATN